MELIGGSMENNKPQNDAKGLRRYWLVFIPLTIVLALMVKFPLRIDLRESFYDCLFYGTISLICVATAIHAFRRFHRRSYWLIVILLLCSLLSGWQVVDMGILRYEGPPAYTFAGSENAFEPLHHGWAWYNLRYPSDKIMCHSLFERYYGNNFIAIAYDIDRKATWFACGG
jgi:hypothetical protein